MKLGLFFDLRNPEPWARPWPDVFARNLDLVERAEQGGLGSVWFTEHHLFSDGYLPQPLTFLAAVAARTRTITIGTAVLLAALRPAPLVAEEAAVVDQISGGRLQLGIGAGYSPREYELYDKDLSKRYGLTDAAVAEIRRLLDDGVVTPPPAQRPFPIWLGYQGPQGARRAGRLGVGLLSLDRRLLEPYREGLVEGGHDPASARTGGMLDIVVADDPEATLHRILPHFLHQANTYAESRGGRHRRRSPGAHRREGHEPQHHPGADPGSAGAHPRRRRDRHPRGHRRRTGRARLPVGQRGRDAGRRRRPPHRAALHAGRPRGRRLISGGRPQPEQVPGYRSPQEGGLPMNSGEVRWGFVSVGALALIVGAVAGFVPVDKGYETVCDAVFVRPVPSDYCSDVRSGLTWAVVVLGVGGLALVVFGLAGRLRGGRLVVAGALVLAMAALGVGGAARLLRYDECGSVTTPSEWPKSPTPNGSIRPAGCDGVIPTRRAQAVGLWAGAVALGAALVVVVRRAPDPDAVPRPPVASGAAPPA